MKRFLLFLLGALLSGGLSEGAVTNTALFAPGSSNDCAATLSDELKLHVPIISYNSGMLYLKADASCQLYEGTILCVVTGYSAADPAAFSNCAIATVSPGFEVYMPIAFYNEASYWGNFEYYPTSDGMIWIKLASYGGGGGIYGAREMNNYAIAAGETVDVGGDLTITDTGSVQIAGDLRANEDLGQGITIIAEGDINVTDSVTAGKGARGGGTGGTVTLESRNGNITIEAGASLNAGDGSEGSAVATGAGGTGGSVILKAPNGTITIPDAEGVIHIGSGGNGADLAFEDSSSLQAISAAQEGEGPAPALNKGGNSGGVSFEFNAIIGLDYETGTATSDVTDPDGKIVIPAGTIYQIINDSKPFSGGNGGNAGSLTVGAVSGGAQAASGKSREALVYAAAANANIPADATGADGGESSGGRAGDGGNASVTGIDGSTSTNWDYSQDGQTAYVTGGNGGDCSRTWVMWMFRNCQPGTGGWAVAKGGKGGKGRDPNGRGGNGGYASASGGNGGVNENLPYGDRDYYGGVPGNAFAYGGIGGDGGDGCGAIKDWGGEGGYGGIGKAWGGNDFYRDLNPFFELDQLGHATAYGGDGGNGGDGKNGGRSGGFGGKAEVSGRPGYRLAVEGSRGADGTTCPGGQPGVPKITDIPGTYSFTGTKTSNDTCGTLTHDHIENPAVSITTSGTTVTVHSTTNMSGEYNGSNGTFKGVGTTTGLTETIDGGFSQDTLGLWLRGLLLFEYSSSSATCHSEYSGEYKKQ